MDRGRFEELVASAVAGLPAEFRSLLDNVDVVVEDSSSPAQRRKSGGGGLLLGLYEGIPRVRRSSGYNLVVPDKITIFQRAVESICKSDAEIEHEIRNVVTHEIAHYFGLDDRELEQIEKEKGLRPKEERK